MCHCKEDRRKWEGLMTALLVRHISLEIIRCRKLLVCFGFYVLFIRLFVGVPLSLRDINQILSVNIKESLLSYCQQGLRRFCIVRDISVPASYHPCDLPFLVTESWTESHFTESHFLSRAVRVFGPVWFWNSIIVSPLHCCLLPQEICGLTYRREDLATPLTIYINHSLAM